MRLKKTFETCLKCFFCKKIDLNAFEIESKAREIVREIHKDLKDKIISDLSNARSIHIIVDESPDARRQSMIHIMVRYILYTI